MKTIAIAVLLFCSVLGLAAQVTYERLLRADREPEN